MARRPGLATSYRYGEYFRSHCLAGSGSLLWPNDRCWKIDVLDELWSAFGDHPDTTEDKSFLDKLHDQLANSSADTIKVAADVLAFYLLYPDKYSSESKLDLLGTVLGWRQWATQPDLAGLKMAFDEGGVGYPGVFYNTGRPFHFAYIVQLGRLALRHQTPLDDSVTLSKLADEALNLVPTNVSLMRNVALHMMMPDAFERVASNSQRVAIVERYADLTHRELPIDSQLAEIRASLEQSLNRPQFDFYDSDVWNEWRPADEASSDFAETPAIREISKVWVEKTHVANRPDRIDGEFALGRALWSPARARDGSDMYRFMREVSPGDYVLHLTDNQGFTGVSRIASRVSDFNGVPNTQWSDRPSYLVRLESFRELDPPLGRETFFNSPIKERLLQLLANGLRNTFYGRDGNLNQGAYLTPAPPALVDVLNSAYRSFADKDLLEFATAPQAVNTQPAASTKNELSELARVTFHDEAELAEILAIIRSRKQAIFEGPPGAGKTFLATLIARHLAGIPLDDEQAENILTVQFHQSYSYEDFVEGIRPVVTEQGLTYEVRAGVFRDFCETAKSRPDMNFVCVIDEINRGNISRIFGELLFALEYRDRAVSLTYSGITGEKFRIPQKCLYRWYDEQYRSLSYSTGLRVAQAILFHSTSAS